MLLQPNELQKLGRLGLLAFLDFESRYGCFQRWKEEIRLCEYFHQRYSVFLSLKKVMNYTIISLISNLKERIFVLYDKFDL